MIEFSFLTWPIAFFFKICFVGLLGAFLALLQHIQVTNICTSRDQYFHFYVKTPFKGSLHTKMKICRMKELGLLTWPIALFFKICFVGAGGSFHTKSTKKSDFWTGPFLIFFKFGTHYYAKAKISDRIDSISSSYRASNFPILAKFDEN